jgi:hypothetical protein
MTRKTLNFAVSAALAALSLIPTMAPAETTHKVGWIGDDKYPIRFYSNVTAQDMIPLLAGHVWVSEYQDGLTTHALRIIWYGNDGRDIGCGSDARPGNHLGQYWPTTHGKWQPTIVDAKWRHVKYPLFMVNGDKPLENGTPDLGYSLLRYDPSTGGLSSYGYADRRWWRLGTGRLQEELPAVTWKLCPDFPSAKSLGAKVDARQTAGTYDEVIAQGGTPIKRPDLVTDHPEQNY